MQGVLGLYEPQSGRPLLRIQHGMAREWFDRMPEFAIESAYYWGGPERVASYPMGELIIHSLAHPELDHASNRFAVGWVRPQGIEDFAAMSVAQDPAGLGTLVFTSARKLEQSDEREMELLRLLSPHIRRAIAISRVLDFKTYQEQNLRHATDVLPHGVVLLSASRHVLYANPAAEAVFLSNDAVRAIDGRLTMREPDLAAAMDAAVEACSSGFGSSERGNEIPARGSNGARAVLNVLPLGYGRLRSVLDANAVAAVFIATEGIRGALPKNALRFLYDLTPAEIKVCELLLDGSTPTEISGQVGVAVSTIRTHLLRIFEKTGSRRQSELIRQIAPLMMSQVVDAN